MSLLLNNRANHLAMAVEVCSKLAAVTTRVLKAHKARDERLRALFRAGEVRDVLRHKAGIRETVAISRGPQWTRTARFLAAVLAPLFALSFITGPALQSLVNFVLSCKPGR